MKLQREIINAFLKLESDTCKATTEDVLTYLTLDKNVNYSAYEPEVLTVVPALLRIKKMDSEFLENQEDLEEGVQEGFTLGIDIEELWIGNDAYTLHSFIEQLEGGEKFRNNKDVDKLIEISKRKLSEHIDRIEARLKVQILADEFSEQLLAEIGYANLKEVVARNKGVDDGSCASHDFTDANMVMLTAFNETGLNPHADSDNEVAFMEDDTLLDLWNSAWEIARKNDFNFNEIPTVMDLISQELREAGYKKESDLTFYYETPEELVIRLQDDIQRMQNVLTLVSNHVLTEGK